MVGKAWPLQAIHLQLESFANRETCFFSHIFSPALWAFCFVWFLFGFGDSLSRVQGYLGMTELNKLNPMNDRIWK